MMNERQMNRALEIRNARNLAHDALLHAEAQEYILQEQANAMADHDGFTRDWGRLQYQLLWARTAVSHAQYAFDQAERAYNASCFQL